ncbi:MAG: stage II sporulation protein M, partial [Chloroflexi bacterium]|nr:stage II sporulation protein M [Chloroflexota bacterium]
NLFMNLHDFIEIRQPHWRQLEKLLQRAGRNLALLSDQELADLGRLYRLAASDLAVAQRDYAGQRVAIYLNQLVGRAHALIYQGEPLRFRSIQHFYSRSFPQLYRHLWSYTTFAFLLFLLPALASLLIVLRNPDAIYIILGPGIDSLVKQVEQGKLWTDIAPSVRSAASTAILTNNIQVMFLTFAGGITAGLLTVWILISNGLNLGAIFGLLQSHGLSSGLAGFILAHGFIELSVIFFAGGCGLYLADGLLRPGLLARRDALVQRGSLAVRLILGCVPFLILAGLIEGFISPSSLPWWFKLMVGLATGGLLYGYWLLVGRDRTGHNL